MTTIANSPALLEHIIDDLACRGWSVNVQAVDPLLVDALAAECRQRHAAGQLIRAGIGHGDTHQLDRSVRGDHIQWLDPGESPLVDQYLALLDQLREQLNRELFLGLEDYECHFALYPPGSFYKRHLDRFRDDDRRTVTTVFYLNSGWQADEGGALRMELRDGSQQDVLPASGTLVVFLSDEFPHEVLPASRERLSITGWYRRRADNPLLADPTL